MRVVRLYGPLANEFGPSYGREFRLAVSSPREALVALCAQIPGFSAALAKCVHGLHVRTGRRWRGDADFAAPCGAGDEIRLIPATAASGAKTRTAVGTVMAVVGYMYGGPVGGMALSSGLALAMGGVAELLAKKPGTTDYNDSSTQGYAFSGEINTTGQGVGIPKSYGRLLDGTHIISARTIAEEGVLYASMGEMHPGVDDTAADVLGTTDVFAEGSSSEAIGNEAPSLTYAPDTSTPWSVEGLGSYSTFGGAVAASWDSLADSQSNAGGGGSTSGDGK